jgi:hypothetical protein
VALGTIQTYATAGTTLRIGRNISGFPVKLIQPSAPAAPALLSSARPNDAADRASSGRWELYAFVGVDGRAKLHDYFLEGSLFRNDPGVEPEDFVWDFQYGLVGELCGWRLAYTINRRSQEFEDVPGSGIGIHNFVSVSLSRALGR